MYMDEVSLFISEIAEVQSEPEVKDVELLPLAPYTYILSSFERKIDF